MNQEGTKAGPCEEFNSNLRGAGMYDLTSTTWK